jgi:hypothetical protein
MFNDYDISLYNTISDRIYKEIANKTKKPININDINIGNTVMVEFMPYSQKYIYHLYPKYGTVNSIYKKIDNEIEITIKNLNGEIENLLHEGVSYLGTSLGYEYQIYLI